MSGEPLVRVWWWNQGAHSSIVRESLVESLIEELRASGFYCWRTQGVPIEIGADPPAGS